MEKDKINRKAVMIGGSAGSLEVILNFIPKLDADLNFPIIIILHRKNSSDSTLSELISYKTKMPVKEVEDKDVINNSTVYVAPADYHLLIEKDYSFSLDYSEKVNFSRPSIDVSFEAASEIYIENLVCILLSGANTDGVEGLKKVKSKNGLVIVQNPLTAEMPFMPQQAINENLADYILNPDQIASFINSLDAPDKKI